jgi:hypothetical protein
VYGDALESTGRKGPSSASCKPAALAVGGGLLSSGTTGFLELIASPPGETEERERKRDTPREIHE